MLVDLHSHSKNSPDAFNTVAEMCDQAEKLGLSAYAITDHIECEDRYWCDVDKNGNKMRTVAFSDIFNNSMEEIAKEKDKRKNKLNLICGIEIGEMCHNPDIAEQYINDPRLDFVIASLHNIRNKEDFYCLDYDKEDIKYLLDNYFEEIYEMCCVAKFDILGHLTYTLRYMVGEWHKDVDISCYDDIINESFKKLVENGKGIEINSSGKRQKFGDFFPSFKYVRMFKQCGGEILSVGSDSHRVEDIAKDASEAIFIAREAGFKYISYFKNRKPCFIKI